MSPRFFIPKRFSFSLRRKLLLVSLSLFIIPWMGFQYIHELERHLRQQQQEMLLDKARLASNLLKNEARLFETFVDRNGHGIADETIHHLYIRPLHSPIQLDGYAEDWEPYAERFISHHSVNDPGFSFSYIAGTYREYLYVICHVTDRQIVYRKPNSLKLDHNDFIQIAMENPQGEQVNYIIATTGPGWVNAQRLSNNGQERTSTGNEFRIKGEWQESDDGYTVEFRIPQAFIGRRLAFSIADVDDPQPGNIRNRLETSNTSSEGGLGTVSITTPLTEKILNEIGHDNTRIWITDRNRRVLSMQGEIAAGMDAVATQSRWSERMTGLLYSSILGEPGGAPGDPDQNRSVMEGDEITAALQGRPATAWRSLPGRNISILSASHPVLVDGAIVGAVTLEESSSKILILQNQALQNIVSITLIAFSVTSLGLLLFSSIISNRVTRLRNDINECIDHEGKIVKRLDPQNSADEIGDLSAGFARMLDRLHEYNDYLENIRGTLSHELRTPLTIVRSSIENLEQALEGKQENIYIRRAQEGIAQLGGILNRMSEATRIEQAMQHSEKSCFDLNDFLQRYLDGYQGSHPSTPLAFTAPPQAIHMQGIPELMAQMLDKLISNAADYRAQQTPVTIELSSHRRKVTLRVINVGPPLPAAMREHIFDPMVSQRTLMQPQETKPVLPEPLPAGPQQSTPQHATPPVHLGLGLYIARLICEFHNGSIRAENISDPERVAFIATFRECGKTSLY